MKMFENFDARLSGHYHRGEHCSFVGTALAIGLGVASAAASVGGGIIAKKGADNQAKAIETASQEANQIQKDQYNQNRTDLAPYRNSGYAALNRLDFLLGITPQQDPSTAAPSMTTAPSQRYAALNNVGSRYADQRFAGLDGQDASTFDQLNSGFDPNAAPTSTQQVPTGQGGDFGSLMKDFSTSDFQKDPGYDFNLSEGSKAIERSAAARGSVLGGKTIKALQRFTQDYASNEFSKAYDRYNINKNSKYNYLMGVTGIGQNATNNTVTAGTTAANTISNNIITSGNNAAASRASGYNALAGGITGGLSSGLNTYYQLTGSGKVPNPKAPGGTPTFFP